MADQSKDVKGKQAKVPAAEAARPTEQVDPLDTTKLDGQIYEVLKNRVERGKAHQEEWWSKGLNTRKFIKGDQWAADLSKLITPANGWIRKSINKMKALETGLISQVAFQQPRVVALPLRRTPAFQGMANVEATLINYALTESDFDSEQMKIAKDALHFGAGFAQVGTNPEKSGITKVMRVPAEDVVYDPDAKSPEDAKWVARKKMVNVHVARKKFKEPSLISDQEHQRVLKSSNAIPPTDAKKLPKVAPEDETVEIWEVWCRADSLSFADASEMSERNKVKDMVRDDAPAFLKHLSETGNRVFHLSLTHPKLLKDAKWPFVLDNNVLPIWPVYLDLDTEGVLPASALTPAKGLQQAINTMYTFLVTQAYVTARVKFVGDKAQMAEDNIQSKLKSPVIGEMIGVEGGGLSLQMLNFGTLNTSMVQLFRETNQQFDAVTGFNEIFGGMQGARSATEASIREGRAQTNSSMMRAAFESGLKRVLRMMVQVAHSTLKATKVAEFVGREEMGYVNPETGLVDDNDELNTLAVNWDDKMTVAEIRRENRIELAVNSTRRVNQQQEVADMRNLVQDLVGLIGVYTQQGYRVNQVRIARKLNYVFSRLLQALGIPDFKQMEVLPEDLSVDDRLMPRGQTEEQAFAKFQKEQAEKAGQEDVENAEGIVAFMEAVQGGDPVAAQTAVSTLTPEQRTALIQAIQQQQVEG